MKATAAQGLAIFDEYSAEIHQIVTEGKYEQLLLTSVLAQKHGGRGDETVSANTDFVTLVVVPDAGVPNAPLTQFDLLERARKLFAHQSPGVYRPGVVPVLNVQLLEGMADLAELINLAREATSVMENVDYPSNVGRPVQGSGFTGTGSTGVNSHTDVSTLATAACARHLRFATQHRRSTGRGPSRSRTTPSPM